MARPSWLVLALALAPIASAAAGDPRPDDGAAGSPLAKIDATIGVDARAHWAFRPVRRPEVPKVGRTEWVRNPIDAFILSSLEAAGWSPTPPAPPRALIRRLHFDLVGLPPSPEEVEAFVRDASPTATDRAIESLLASPRHGERWGRHWLDLVRYAETNGFERDAIKPNAWKYRDYIVQAFNDDTPYDRFLLEQLAGDELPDATDATRLATTYYRLGPWDDEPADPAQDRFDQLDDLVATTAEVTLGLTLACARCHDHKFEPLTQADYYRLVAVFAPLERPRDDRTERDVPLGTPEQVRAETRRDAAVTRLQAQRALAAREPSAGESAAAIAYCDREIARLKVETPDLPRGYLFVESPAPATTHLLIRGQATNPGPEVPPGVPAVLVDRQPVFPARRPGSATSGRRLALARLLTSPEHPLTARVIVNRVWQHHFGAGLVRTPSDFGTMGEPPTHPELLDWLADWFVAHGWSIKALHRLILSSNAYRMASDVNPAYQAEDPEDRRLWRMPRRRLEAEAIRDAILAVSGGLNPAIGGPSMRPPIPRAALEGSSDPGTTWVASSEREASRRTVYLFVKRSLVEPLVEALDFGDTARSTARRNVTSVPTQALTLLNGDLVNRESARLADRLVREAGDDPARQVDRAFALALGRRPSGSERAALLDFLRTEAKGEDNDARDLKDEPARRRALARLGRVIFNLNEFVYVD